MLRPVEAVSERVVVIVDAESLVLEIADECDLIAHDRFELAVVGVVLGS